jgi:hypothetical protein
MPQAESTVAFFPGFPYFWKFTGLGVYGISVVNYIITIVATYFLAKSLGIENRIVLLFLSIPSCFFFFIPYSEALFFFTATLLLIGLKNNKIWLIILGLFLCSIFRSSANIFIPAIIIMELIGEGNWVSKLKRTILFMVAALSGILLTAYIQFLQTGEWWGFLQTQQHWGHFLQWPHFPFSSWSRVAIPLDACALFIGISAMGIAIMMVFKWLFLSVLQHDKAFVFSCLCLAGLTAFAIAFKGGVMFSLNRYLLVSPFMLVFMHGIGKHIKVNPKTYITIGMAVLGFGLLFGSYVHLSRVLTYLALAGYIVAFFHIIIKESKNSTTPFTWLVYLCGLSMQMYLFSQFAECVWIG